MAKKPTTTAKKTAPKKTTPKRAEPATEGASTARETTPPARFGATKNPDEAKLFLQHMGKVAAQRDKLATVTADLRNLYKVAKGDGFDKSDFDIGIAIQSAEGEAKQRAKISRTIEIANHVGKWAGQLDLFAVPDRTPAAEIAFKEGQVDSQTGKSANPGYDPSTEQYREYMRGFHEDTEQRVQAGIKPLESSKDDDVETVAPKTTPASEPPKSGIVMTRADYIKQKQAAEKAKDEAEQVARALVPDQPSSLFKKRPQSA